MTIGTTPIYTIKKETVNLKTIQTYCKENKFQRCNLLSELILKVMRKSFRRRYIILKSQKMKNMIGLSFKHV